MANKTQETGAIFGKFKEVYSSPKERKGITINVDQAQAYVELMRDGIKTKYGVDDSAVNMASHQLTGMSPERWSWNNSLWGMGHDRQAGAEFAQLAVKGKWNVNGVKPVQYPEYFEDVFQMTAVSERLRANNVRGTSPDPENVKKIKDQLTGVKAPESSAWPTVSEEPENEFKVWAREQGYSFEDPIR